MGFEHTMPVDRAVGHAAIGALEELVDWTTERYGHGDGINTGWVSYYVRHLVPAMFTSPDEQMWIYEVPASEFFSSDTVQYLRDGRCVLWWSEIPWLHKLPSDVMQRFYQLLDAHGALEVWASIMHGGSDFADKIVGKLADIFPADGELSYFTRDGERIVVHPGGDAC